MAIVWSCPLSVDAYVARGTEIEVPRVRCPSCGEATMLWGSYERYVRSAEMSARVAVHRVRCAKCQVTHALLPDFVMKGRLDTADVIGRGVEDLAQGLGARTSARAIGVPHTTLRDWRRRVAARLDVLVAGFLAAGVALGELAPRALSSGPRGLIVAIAFVVRAARRRGVAGSPWRIANRICGAELVATNTNPPFRPA